MLGTGYECAPNTSVPTSTVSVVIVLFQRTRTEGSPRLPAPCSNDDDAELAVPIMKAPAPRCTTRGAKRTPNDIRKRRGDEAGALCAPPFGSPDRAMPRADPSRLPRKERSGGGRQPAALQTNGADTLSFRCPGEIRPSVCRSVGARPRVDRQLCRPALKVAGVGARGCSAALQDYRPRKSGRKTMHITAPASPIQSL